MILRKLTVREIVLILSLAAPVALVCIWQGIGWPVLLLIAWIIGVAAAGWLMERRKHRQQCDLLLKHAQMSAIRTLSHHRHDWMNELQILYGYLRLNKLDKAADVVERIRERMDHDSKLSHIGIPELAVFLLSFRTVCDSMRLDVKVEDGLSLDRPPYNSEQLARAVIGLVNVIRFRAVSNMGQDNVLRLSFYESADGLALDMVYEGELAASESVQSDLEKCVEGLGQIAMQEEPAEKPLTQRTMIVRFPLPA